MRLRSESGRWRSGNGIAWGIGRDGDRAGSVVEGSGRWSWEESWVLDVIDEFSQFGSRGP